MSELSPRARALLDAAEGGDGPTSSDQRRVRSALIGRLGAGAFAGASVGAAAGSGAAAAGAKTALAMVALKAVGAVALVGALGGGAYAIARHSAPPPAGEPNAAVAANATGAATGALAANDPPPIPKDTMGVEAPPAVTETASPSEAVPPAAASTGAARSAPPPNVASNASRAPQRGPANRGGDMSSASGAALSSTANADPAPPAAMNAAAPSPAATSTLEAETKMLRDAQAALRDGRPDSALAILDEHGQRYRDGLLQEERSAARVVALCSAGKGAEARSEAERFLKAWPRSPFAERVRSACAAK